MKKSEVLISILKAEGLRIVDEDGFSYESEEENVEAWQNAIAAEHHPNEKLDLESAFDSLEEDRKRRAVLEHLWYERRVPKIKDEDAVWRGEMGEGFINNEVMPPDKWVDPAGGIHDWNEDDPAKQYI